MRPWRRRCGPRPVAAHDSGDWSLRAPTITALQRNAIYRQILDRLNEVGYLSCLVEQDDLVAARRLAREVSDDLALILDGLGWGETASDGAVKLALPPEQLRRVFSRLREQATEQRRAVSLKPGGTQTRDEHTLIVVETCDQVLTTVGGETRGRAG